MPRLKLETPTDLKALVTDDEWKQLREGNASIDVCAWTTMDQAATPGTIYARKLTGGMSNTFATLSCYWYEDCEPTWKNNYEKTRIARIRIHLYQVWAVRNHGKD